MDPVRFGTHPVVITRAAGMRWHAVDDDCVAGRAEAWYRPDGRLFLSVDSWHSAVFDQLAVGFLISNDDRSRIGFDHLTFDSKIFDRDAIAIPQV